MKESRKPMRNEGGGPLGPFRALKMPPSNRLAGEAGRAGALMLAIALMVMLIAIGLAGAEGARADAAQLAELRIGSENNYGGYHTTWMWADGEVAYCANPFAKTPKGGSYSKHALSAPSGRTAETAADLWFGYGSPGFDASLWPSEWYDGAPMTNARYAALAHILLSDTYTSDSSYALFGCNADFKRWCRYHVFGFDAEGNLSNENATGRLVAVRAGEMPDNFHPFELRAGAETQLILSFSYIPNGHIDLVKMSANPQVSDGNALYSCEGAVYGVYADGACSKKVAEIRTDADGYGRAEDLAVGDYWVKETKQPSGMAVDPTVYTVEVKLNETVRANGGFVSDVPQSAAVGLVLAKKDATAGSGAPQGERPALRRQVQGELLRRFLQHAGGGARVGKPAAGLDGENRRFRGGAPERRPPGGGRRVLLPDRRQNGLPAVGHRADRGAGGAAGLPLRRRASRRADNLR